MNLFKYIAVMMLVTICLAGMTGVSQAADYSITFGLPMFYGFEFEGRATDQLTYCLDYSYFPVAGVDMSATSIGGKIYLTGQAMDGVYAGVQLGVLDGSGKFLGLFDVDIDSDTYAQFRVGYKKAMESGFTYDLGIYGIAFDGGNSGAGMTMGLGYSW